MITIKECQNSQLDLLFKIAVQSYDDTYQYLWLDKGITYLKECYRKEDFEKELSAPLYFYSLIYDSVMAAGYFKLNNNGLAKYPDDLCIGIDKLYLLHEYTNKGIGKAVMEFIIFYWKKNQRTVF